MGAPERQGRTLQGQGAPVAPIEELQSVDYQKRNETNEIFIPPGERLGNSVIEFKGVSKSFGDRLLIDDLSFVVPPGAIVGIIGPNGAGKSTLFKMITGQEKPDRAKSSSGPTVKLAYVDQSREKLEGNHNVFQEVSGGADILNINGIEIQSRAYIGRFNFKGQDQQKLVGTLSGGERGRLHLAKTLLQGGNVLLLDEPSNDLDIETLRALEDALLEFPAACLRDLARPLVPRSHRHPHPGLRRRLARRVLPGQLPRIRRRQEAPPRRSAPSSRRLRTSRRWARKRPCGDWSRTSTPRIRACR
jgi:ATPase subunit of ABC transporter with duplicated ATPase domains